MRQLWQWRKRSLQATMVLTECWLCPNEIAVQPKQNSIVPADFLNNI